MAISVSFAPSLIVLPTYQDTFLFFNKLAIEVHVGVVDFREIGALVNGLFSQVVSGNERSSDFLNPFAHVVASAEPLLLLTHELSKSPHSFSSF